MVGSLDYFDDSIDGQVNVALASRQPGSSFKPYTYLTAFESGASAPASMVMDVRTVFPDPGNPPYVPENYDRKYHGPQIAAPGAAALLQHPGRLADGPGGRRQCHQDRAARWASAASTGS